MPWEYLQSPDFAGRLTPLAAAIGEWADGARVIDINCGTAPMAALLTGYRDYLGNDLSAEFIAAARAMGLPNTRFVVASDETLDTHCDILLYLGMGGGEFTGEPLESRTATDTFHRLLRYGPAVVGIETVRLWETRYGAVAALESALQAANYDRIDGGDVDLPGAEFWSQRMWRLYAK